MNDERAYYERYWTNPEVAPPSSDPTTPERREPLRAALAGLPSQAAVLDLGCGTGEFTQFMNDLGFASTGIDLSLHAVEVAAGRFPSCAFRAGAIGEFADEMAGTFHAIWCSETIEHVFDVYGLLEFAHRCLMPQGLLVLTTPYHGLAKNLLIDLFGYGGHYNPFGGHIRFFDRKSLSGCLYHCGFSAASWSGVGRHWPLYKSFFVVARKTHSSAPPRGGLLNFLSRPLRTMDVRILCGVPCDIPEPTLRLANRAAASLEAP